MTSKHDKVLISEARLPIEPIVMSEAEWLIIQDRLGAKISSDTRKKLLAATNLYASSRRDRNATKLLSEVEAEIRQWRKRTEILRNQIWAKDPVQANKEAEELKKLVGELHYNDYMIEADLNGVLDRFFSKSPTQIEFRRPTARFDRFLKGFIALGELFKIILSIEAEAAREHRTWLLWAALVLAILRKSGVAVKHPSKNQLRSGPVAVLDRLHAKLPTDLQRRKTKASLRKGAVIAWKVRRGIEPQALLTMLRRWTKGDYRQRKSLGNEVQVPSRMARLAEKE